VSPLNIFLDNGGVITGKERQAAEFERLVGNCLVPLLGGTEEAWVRAHRVVVDRLADPQSARALAADFVGFYRAYQLRWVGGMCELLGLPTPPEEECLDLAYRALSWITRRIHAALPGAVEAIRLLLRQGYTLHTASGACSLETGWRSGRDGRAALLWSSLRSRPDQHLQRRLGVLCAPLRRCWHTACSGAGRR
jgi:hypothetical protein